MATQAIRQIQWAHNESGSANPEVYDQALEANSQTFVAGDLLYLNSGAVTIYTADGTRIAGIALEAGTNVSSGNTAITYMKIRPTDRFIMNLSTGVTAVGNVGTAYGLTASSAGKWTVDTSDTNHPRVEVCSIVLGPDTDTNGTPFNRAVGDTYGQVIVKFLALGWDHDSTAAVSTLQG